MGKNGKKSNGKTREKVERARYELDLPVPATDKEVGQAASGMVAQIRKREAVLEERRDSMAKFREQLTAIDQRLGEYADTVENHTKLEKVKCVELLTVETSTIEVVRLDTDDVVETRAASAEDLQENLLPKGEDDGDEAELDA